MAANARALPELVQHDVNGLLFNAHNPANLAATIDRFLAMQTRWRWMGEASLEGCSPQSRTRSSAMSSGTRASAVAP
ncbi:MAG: hypothetical protein IPK16_33270 [Anaerolineales bacterium]|nr:hypothetical protein [Anaerolineales bacterium]